VQLVRGGDDLDLAAHQRVGEVELQRARSRSEKRATATRSISAMRSTPLAGDASPRATEPVSRSLRTPRRRRSAACPRKAASTRACSASPVVGVVVVPSPLP
jgi:hypothetical protein